MKWRRWSDFGQHEMTQNGRVLRTWDYVDGHILAQIKWRRWSDFGKHEMWLKWSDFVPHEIPKVVRDMSTKHDANDQIFAHMKWRKMVRLCPTWKGAVESFETIHFWLTKRINRPSNYPINGVTLTMHLLIASLRLHVHFVFFLSVFFFS